MYYQMNMKQRELTVIGITISHIPPPNLSIYAVFYTPLMKFLMKYLILLVIQRLLFNV